MIFRAGLFVILPVRHTRRAAPSHPPHAVSFLIAAPGASTAGAHTSRGNAFVAPALSYLQPLPLKPTKKAQPTKATPPKGMAVVEHYSHHLKIPS